MARFGQREGGRHRIEDITKLTKTKMKGLKKITLIQLVVSISMLSVAFSMAYFFTVYLPAKEKSNQELVEKELQLKEAEIQKQRSETEIYKVCAAEAERRAVETLKSKVEVMEGSGSINTQSYKILREASEKELYLKDDYNASYNTCLREYGLKH